MTRILRWWVGGGLAAAAFAVAGCAGSSSPPAPAAAPAPAAPAAARAEAGDEDAEVAAERAKLSPEDRALVEAQEWCAINTGERLGSMGPPLKLDIKGQPVFLCCGGCRKKAEADPDKTLAKVAELKAKKAGAAAKP